MIVFALVIGALVTMSFNRPSVKNLRLDSSFHSVHDRPVVETLPRYYELVQKGKCTITMGGSEYTIFWQDFSAEERHELSSMLRVP